jgi:hypothetical protein
MKKVRISIPKGSSGKSFNIFNSTESVYVWLFDPVLKSQKNLDPSLGNTVHLKKGEFMEVEWRGYELIYENSDLLFKTNFIRLCKNMTSIETNKFVVGIQDGWILSGDIEFKTKACKDYKTTLLNKRSRHKFDLDELFAERDDYSDEDFLSDTIFNNQYIN